MKFAITVVALACIAPAVTAFSSPSFAFVRSSSSTSLANQGSSGDELIFGGNTWKPKSETMGSTDTGDFFPDDYEAQVEFSEGMMGSQMGANKRDGPQLPGMENLGDDAVMMGGIEVDTDIPEGMEFVAASVPDGNIEFQVAANSSGGTFALQVKPFCMSFEDYYACFTSASHPTLKVSPAAGRMDRRGGEVSEFVITCEPNGKAGTFEGDLVINLPEDNSKLSYKVSVTSF